jgi:exosortase/archaeosortase family protein
LAEDGNNPGPAEEPVSPPVRYFWAGLVVLLALPVAKWWQLTSDWDAVMALVAIAVGMLVWLREELAQRPADPSVGAGLVSLLFLSFVTWQLGWLRSGDFWVLRAAMGGVAGCLCLLLWGWTGLLVGWRPLAALGLWTALPSGFVAFDWELAWLCEVTARAAGTLLWYLGWEARVVGAAIYLPTGSVVVGAPCTCVPLIGNLLCLFVAAVLLLRVPWRRALLAALASVALAFVISIARVAVMVLVVEDDARFQYWHGSDGAAWFTAPCMIGMAMMILRAAPRSMVPSGFALELGPGQVWTAGILGIGATVGLLAALGWTTTAPPAWPSPPAELAGYRLSKFTEVPTERWTIRPTEPPFSRVRMAEYQRPADGARIVMITGYAPRSLEEHPLLVASHYPWFALGTDKAQWREHPAAGGSVLERATTGQLDWLATVPPGGRPIASPAGWRGHLRQYAARPGHLWRWLAGREPWIDKRAYWLALSWSGATGMDRQALGDHLQAWLSAADSTAP